MLYGERIPNAKKVLASAINALDAHGLDHCPDHGMDGFERYVPLAVVGRNLDSVQALSATG